MNLVPPIYGSDSEELNRSEVFLRRKLLMRAQGKDPYFYVSLAKARQVAR